MQPLVRHRPRRRLTTSVAVILIAMVGALGLPGGGGAAAETRIVGGTKATAGELPWQVALITASNPNNFNGQFCGGSLISATVVLTAAHCVDGSAPSSVDVLAGTIKLSTGGQRIDVKKVTVHPSYSSSTSAWDFAVLELMTAAVAPAAPIPFAGGGDGASWVPGTMATTSGWGALAEAGGYPDDLYEVQVPIVSDATCAASYGTALKADSMVCAGLAAGGKDSCQGDSGGPLAVQKPDSSWLLVGVVSWGTGCARPNLYGVYSEIAAATAWISAQLGGGGGGAPTVTSLSPAIGVAGTVVTITGTNLTGATSVRFGASAASQFRVQSATSIRVKAPAGTGPVGVTVTTPGGTSTASAASTFTYSGGGGGSAPTVTNLSPSSGPAGSMAPITITGTNFTAVTSVRFGATSAQFVVDSSTKIRARAPGGCAGLVDVTVTTSGGTSTTGAASRFTCT